MKLTAWFFFISVAILISTSHRAMCTTQVFYNRNTVSAGKTDNINLVAFSTGKSLKIRVYLEGALLAAPNVFSSEGRKLMRDGLRVSPFDGKNYIPVSDPYQTVLNFVDLSSKYAHIGMGAMPEYSMISDSAGVFGVTGENAIVDWVFVEIRAAEDDREVIATRSGLLQRDGDVVDIDGSSDLFFPDLTAENFYVAIFHRNHLGCCH